MQGMIWTVTRLELVFVALLLALLPGIPIAVVPPHTNGDDRCSKCHLPHRATGGTPTSARVATWPGLPAGTNAAGASHAWDSGPVGRLEFLDATNRSFQLNDKWNLYARPDLRAPASAAVAVRVESGLIMRSTCPDQHSQASQPFAPGAHDYHTNNWGGGRHYMRIANNADRLCPDCRLPPGVTKSTALSHPVEITLVSNTS